MKQKVVVQLETGCRVLINPEPSEYENLPHVINPNLALVRGLSPEDWKIVGGIVTAESPGILPPVLPRSYEQVQEDFLDLRCDVDRRITDEVVKRMSEISVLRGQFEAFRLASSIVLGALFVALMASFFIR